MPQIDGETYVWIISKSMAYAMSAMARLQYDRSSLQSGRWLMPVPTRQIGGLATFLLDALNGQFAPITAAPKAWPVPSKEKFP
jgi:hypothetical protein